MTAQLAADGRLKLIKAVILVDMVGGRGLHILQESNSTIWLGQLVRDSAGELVFDGWQLPVEDDHIPFLQRGIPSVDIIDLSPFKSYHHTAQDTLDKCRAQSLMITGRVVLATLSRLEERLGRGDASDRQTAPPASRHWLQP
jgi:hypothetical protein